MMTKHKDCNFTVRINHLQTQIALLSLTVAALQSELKDLKESKAILIKNEPMILDIKKDHFDEKKEFVIISNELEEI
jgi:hypothetical protein